MKSRGGWDTHVNQGTGKGFAAENLYEGRDLPLTTDYRYVMLEVFKHHLGVTGASAAAGIFPGFGAQRQNSPHLFS